MEDLAPPPAFDLSELSVTEVDIAAEIAKEMQNRSRSTGHDADSTEIDAMIQRSRDLIAMFEKQVSKDEAAQLPPKQPGSASGALTKEIGTDQEPMLNVDTVSVGAADTEISDVQTVIKMSALPASSAESRTTTQPSSASSTPQTSQTPISGDKNVFQEQ